jgi:hypothetical protein
MVGTFSQEIWCWGFDLSAFLVDNTNVIRIKATISRLMRGKTIAAKVCQVVCRFPMEWMPIHRRGYRESSDAVDRRDGT